MDIDESLSYQLLDQTIGIQIEIISNDFKETPGWYDDSFYSYQEIVFQIKEEEPDVYAVGVLFALSLMSFTFAAPRGYSEKYFVPDEEWNIGYTIQGLGFKRSCLCFSADYVSGRLMKTDIVFKSGGKVTVSTRNRGRGAERWLRHLQGNKHIQAVE